MTEKCSSLLHETKMVWLYRKSPQIMLTIRSTEMISANDSLAHSFIDQTHQTNMNMHNTLEHWRIFVIRATESSSSKTMWPMETIEEKKNVQPTEVEVVVEFRPYENVIK